MKLGAFDYITKPFDNEEIVLVIKKALEAQYLSKEVERLRKRLGEQTHIEATMGESPEIKQVIKQVKIIAPTNMTVILQGESGTGKELVAQMIHEESLRRDKPFIAIDCGTIPETLAESELFGYERGAFTGTNGRKEGRFEQANGGTLFLDEITNLSDSVQMKFLRVIQEKNIYHLGGKKEVKVDVRIIVATNTKLTEVVKEGRFRNDLFHRLNEFQINLPALRERKDDIPFLAKYFLDEANDEFNKKIKGFSNEAMKFIFDYHWPGNIRELKNLIKKAVILADTEFITSDQLAIDSSVRPKESTSKEDSNLETPVKASSEELEKNLINKILKETDGNKAKAARILKVNRSTLYRKMKSLKL